MNAACEWRKTECWLSYKFMLILLKMNIWNLNLRHLRALTSIARLGSISAAAEAINLTQPAITQALAKLEIQLGQLLFERHANGMTATPAALLLAPRIERALAHIAGHDKVWLATGSEIIDAWRASPDAA